MAKFANSMSESINTFSTLTVDQQVIQDYLEEDVPMDDPIFVSHVGLLRKYLAIVSKILDIYNKAPTSNITG
ncbi:hypothetical protein K474DRAFT_1776162 [Panus rudis PR-1116 ss-1]|nr:hypothetical protein K474DRAFT_1776162 [Panus rudis PR-1116 ss-1]